MIDVREGRIAGRRSLITLTRILSIPGALFVAIELTMACTCLHSIGSKVNCCNNANDLGMNGLLLSSKLNFNAKSLIFLTVLSSTSAKKELNSFATVISSLL